MTSARIARPPVPRYLNGSPGDIGSTSPAPPAERNPALDGLRGIAVLLVTISHSNVPVLRFGGMTGVTLFFVLSGFLITSLLIGEHDRTGSVSLRSFYVRRALRLLPAMIVAVLVGAVLALLSGQSTTSTLVAGGASLLYVGNIAVVHGISLAPFGAYWSLAMEEQYYLLWPLLLIVGRRVGHRLAIVGTLALIAVSLWLRFHGGITTPDGYRHSYYSPETNLWSLLAGSALAMWACRRPRIALPRGLVPAALAALILVSSVFGMRTGLRETAEPLTLLTRLMAGPLSAASALVLVLHAAQRREQARWLCHDVLLFFGSISYALYLWHGVIDHVLGLRFGSTGVRGLIVGLISAVIATGIAVLSARYVERPFMRLKTRWDPAARARRLEVTAFAS